MRASNFNPEGIMKKKTVEILLVVFASLLVMDVKAQTAKSEVTAEDCTSSAIRKRGEEAGRRVYQAEEFLAKTSLATHQLNSLLSETLSDKRKCNILSRLNQNLLNAHALTTELIKPSKYFNEHALNESISHSAAGSYMQSSRLYSGCEKEGSSYASTDEFKKKVREVHNFHEPRHFSNQSGVKIFKSNYSFQQNVFEFECRRLENSNTGCESEKENTWQESCSGDCSGISTSGGKSIGK